MFDEAWRSIASVVEKSAALPDHRERPREPLVVTCESAGHEVAVVISEAKLSSLWIDEVWAQGASMADVMSVIKDTVNRGLDEWNHKQLDQMMQVTPDLKELDAAIKAAHSQLDAAWVRALGESRMNS